MEAKPWQYQLTPHMKPQRFLWLRIRYWFQFKYGYKN